MELQFEEISYDEISKQGGLFRCSTLPLIQGIILSVAKSILMIRPINFGFNDETSMDNHYQKKINKKKYSSVSS